MDEFLKDYGILVTAVIGLGIAILGYFFGNWDFERKRKWELDDRKVDRRSKVRDDSIKEARLYVDTFWDIVQSYSFTLD